MKYRNVWLKYYAPFDDGTQGGDAGGGSAAQESDEGDGGSHDQGDGEGHGEDNNDDNDPEKSIEKGEHDNGDQDDQEEDILFDGQPLDPLQSDEEGSGSESELVKRLRAQIREQGQQLKKHSSTQVESQARNLPNEIPPKPQLGDEGIDWDDKKLEEAMDQWYEQKSQIEARQQQQQQRAQEFQGKLEERGKVYRDERATAIRKFAGYEKAEQIVAELPEPLQAALLLNSQKPTLTVMALARNEKLRKEIEDAYNSDHIRLGYLIADIDRRAGSAPRVKKDLNGVPEIKGNGAAKNLGQLEQAREKARTTGNWDEYFDLKAKLGK